MAVAATEPAQRRNGVQLIARAASVLRTLADHRAGLSLSELAEAVDLPKSTVHRIVQALEVEDLVAEAPALLPGRLRVFSSMTITARRLLWEELDEVAATGVAYDREEHTEGISAVGAVLGDAFGTMAAVSVPMPTQRFAGREAEVASR